MPTSNAKAVLAAALLDANQYRQMSVEILLEKCILFISTSNLVSSAFINSIFGRMTRFLRVQAPFRLLSGTVKNPV